MAKRVSLLGFSQSRAFSRSAVELALFQRVFANTPELREAAFRVRYQVYCVENPYEDRAKNAAGLEYDQYDQHSLHGVLRHRSSGGAIGSVRWVRQRLNDGPASFPLFSACRDELLHICNHLPLQRTAELSRFAISKEMRQRYCASPVSLACAEGRPVKPEPPSGATIAIHLIALALQIAFVNNIEYMLAAMEPSLLRLLSRFALEFEPMGPLIEYHGRRQPCYAHLPTLMARVESEQPQVWSVMTDDGRAWPSFADMRRGPAKEWARSTYRRRDHEMPDERDALAALA